MIIDHKEAAKLALCHPDTIRKMMASGEAPGTKVGRRWIVSLEVFDKWIEARCRSTNNQKAKTGTSGLAARLAGQLVRPTAPKRKNSSASSKSESGSEKSSEIVVPFPGKKQQPDG